MKIAAVCTAYHEQDILPWTVEHLLSQGIDHIYIQCPEGDTYYQLIDREQVSLYCEPEEFHDQPKTINLLAGIASDLGAEWIIPFDADEFVYSMDISKTIKEALEELSDDVGVCYIGMQQQRDWWWREVPWKPATKIAYRWCPTAKVGPGNHGIEGVPGEAKFNVLALREIQFRNFEHFCRKIDERLATLDPNPFPNQGFHITKHRGKSRSQLEGEWKKLMAEPVIWDPIPTTITPPEHLAPPVDELPINELFELMRHTPTDIHGHMDRLRELAAGKFVLELGVNTGMSTIAFWAGNPFHLFSVDINQPRWRPEVSTPNFCQEDSLTFAQKYENDTTGSLWDVVFIDTSHTMRQTVEELKAYEPKVKPGGCLVLHDTESPEVALAIKHFLYVLDERGRTPTNVERYTHCEGLTIIWLP